MKKIISTLILGLACTIGVQAQEYNLFYDVDAIIRTYVLPSRDRQMLYVEQEGMRTAKPPPFVLILADEAAVTMAPVRKPSAPISPPSPAPSQNGSA